MAEEQILPEFAWRPGYIPDPGPWVDTFLPEDAKVELTQLLVEYQLSINAAQGHFLRGYQNLLKTLKSQRGAAKP